jgi:hypothetical protein
VPQLTTLPRACISLARLENMGVEVKGMHACYIAKWQRTDSEGLKELY